MTRPWIVLVTAIFVLGCPATEAGKSGEPLTGVRLRIQEPDAELAAKMSALSVSLYREEGRTWTRVGAATIPRAKFRWPLDIPILPSSPQALEKRFEVTVDALDAEQKIAQARALFSYEVGSFVLLPISIRSCASAESGTVCAADDCHGDACATCGLARTCEPVLPLDPDDVPAPEPAPDQPLMDAGSGQKDDTLVPDDATPVDASAMDASAVDASAGDAGRLDAGDEAGLIKASACPASAEVCDGADNDCDGKADNGPAMKCARAVREACTLTSGSCSAQGSRECNSGCDWGVCVAPVETLCNRLDDNCSGSADEGLLKVGAPIPLTTFTGTLVDVQVAVSGYGTFALYTTDSGGVASLHGIRIAWNGQPMGPAIAIASGVGKYSGIGWNGSAWSVAYTSSPTTQGIGTGVFVVDIQINGTLGTARTLSTGGPVYNVRMAGSNPAMVIWDEGGGVLAASATGTAEKSQLLPRPTQLGTTDYNRLAVTVLQEGEEWALWASGARTDTTGAQKFPVRYVAFDRNFAVKRDLVLFENTSISAPRELAYMPDSQRLIGLSYHAETGSYPLSTHARDGTTAMSKSDHASRIVAENNGYTQLTASALSRFSATGTLVETFAASSGTFGANPGAFGLVRTPLDSTQRYVIIGSAPGELRYFALGCK